MIIYEKYSSPTWSNIVQDIPDIPWQVLSVALDSEGSQGKRFEVDGSKQWIKARQERHFRHQTSLDFTLVKFFSHSFAWPTSLCASR